MTCCQSTSDRCLVRGKVRKRATVEREATRLALAKVGHGTLLEGIQVRWLGLVWRGVPAPLRWLLEARTGLLPMELPGCGCWDRAKRWQEAAVKWLEVEPVPDPSRQ
jgi:hypothetical protein